MRAVVFDFFGTLTDPSAEPGRRVSFSATAQQLGIDPDAFWDVMSGSFSERAKGSFGGTKDTLAEMARRCGAEPTPAMLDAATRVHRANAAALRAPRPGAVATLTGLRRAGLRIGLISDCSSELVESWPSTPYAPLIDAPVFSWQEGRRKPDLELYATVARRLDVPASQCWYVGDGGSREHWGAQRAGMRPVLITNAGHPQVAGLRDDPDEFRPQDVIDDLTDLLATVCSEDVKIAHARDEPLARRTLTDRAPAP